MDTTIPGNEPTPSVQIDADRLEANITAMASSTRARGVALRPHAKTHKIPEIAALQLAAGAVGLTVATVGEAEVFAGAGVEDIFIAYPLWVDSAKGDRLRRLAAVARITVGVDSAESATALARSLGAAAGEVAVRVELDSGHHRSGVASGDAAGVAVAAAKAGLRVTGAFTFPGHSYAPGMPSTAARDEDKALSQAAAGLRAEGFAAAELSGGSTPSALMGGTATELRPGVYVFGDAQQWELGTIGPDNIALTVAATVVSHHRSTAGEPGHFLLDAGSKILGSDRAAWATGYGRLLEHPEARIVALSEHHATVQWPAGEPLPARGTRLRVVPNHVCLPVNLVDEVQVVRDGAVIDRWAVAARGRNS
ncbi:alanine racemase [uncultured Arthrobacter sp.]|uniref:alanine racemase n=1 Tax=uncultured Arthrobacter sp. TaxID=114050 RepID=UPI0025DA5C00|nr:alanine racemase [uncultured Arthrobacter sp.]